LDDEHHISDEPMAFDIEGFIEARSRPPTTPVSTLREFPHRHKCRVCRSSFRSKRARDGYCSSCRQILDDRTKKLDQIFANAEYASPAIQQEAIKEVRVSLKCNLTVAGAGLPSEWEGNAARYWPTTIPGIRGVLSDFGERAQRHSANTAFPDSLAGPHGSAYESNWKGFSAPRRSTTRMG